MKMNEKNKKTLDELYNFLSENANDEEIELVFFAINKLCNIALKVKENDGKK